MARAATKTSMLGRIAGLEMVWTDNLADHLRMSNDDTKVTFFITRPFSNARDIPQSLSYPMV